MRIVWEGRPEGNSDVFFRASGNEGSSFGSTKNLSNNDGDSESPQIVSSGDKVYVVWQDVTPRNFDILFKKESGLTKNIHLHIFLFLDINSIDRKSKSNWEYIV